MKKENKNKEPGLETIIEAFEELKIATKQTNEVIYTFFSANNRNKWKCKIM
jgi:hypothetical protein